MRPGLAATDLVDLASLIYFSISYLPKHTSGTCTVSNTETTPSILHGKTHTPEHGVYRAPLLPEGAPGQPRAGAHEASPTGAPRTPAAQFLPLVGRHPLHALHRTTFMLPQASTVPQCTCSWTCSLHWPRTSHHSVQIPSQASLLACMPRPAHVWTTPRTAPPARPGRFLLLTRQQHLSLLFSTASPSSQSPTQVLRPAPPPATRPIASGFSGG